MKKKIKEIYIVAIILITDIVVSKLIFDVISEDWYSRALGIAFVLFMAQILSIIFYFFKEYE